MPVAHRLALALTALLLWGAPSAARGAELRLHYRALEKLLVAKAFTADGRFYLQGSAESGCNFTYAEEPAVGAAAGRLRIGFTLHTVLGLEVAGECVGATDSFPAVLSGVPVYADGVLTLSDLRLETEGRSYGQAFGPLITAALAEPLRFPLRQRIEQASQLLWQDTGTRLAVPRLEIGEIRLLDHQLVVELDFAVALR